MVDRFSDLVHSERYAYQYTKNVSYETQYETEFDKYRFNRNLPK